MIIIYLGDTTQYLAQVAKNSDSTAKLITEQNFHHLPDGTYYSSVGEFYNLRNFGAFLQQASKICYTPPPGDVWTGGTKMKTITLDYLESFFYRCEITNFVPVRQDRSTMLTLRDIRKTEGKQIWVAGCSISHGFALEKNTRFGDLIARQLNLEVSFLTYPGSSICWAADQILRSDIRPNDILIWGITSLHRLPFFINESVLHIHPGLLDTDPTHLKYVSPTNLQEDNTTYRHLTSLFQVINFCRKNRVTLVLAGLLNNDLHQHLGALPNFCQLSDLWGRDPNELFLDFGSDDKHPGPQTHEFYAEQIIKHLSKLIDE